MTISICFAMAVTSVSATSAWAKDKTRTKAATPTASVRANIEKRFEKLDLSRLSDTQVEQFARVADDELCPCPKAMDSLGVCLEAPDQTCSLAREAARRLFTGVLKHESDITISKGIGDVVEQAQKVYTFDLRDVPYRGAKKPVVTMVMFGDFECPYCQHMAAFEQSLLQKYSNDLRVYFMHYPLSGHANAMDAAIASLAAQKQGKFWEYHDHMYEQQRALSAQMDANPLLVRWAKELGLDEAQFRADLKDDGLVKRAEKERDAARATGANGTPAIFLNGVPFLDIGSTDALDNRIQTLIKEQKK